MRTMLFRCQPVLTVPSATISSKMPGGQGKQMKAEILSKKGKNVLNDAIFNKGLGFSRSERDGLSIRGLLPSQM